MLWHIDDLFISRRVSVICATLAGVRWKGLSSRYTYAIDQFLLSIVIWKASFHSILCTYFQVRNVDQLYLYFLHTKENYFNFGIRRSLSFFFDFFLLTFSRWLQRDRYLRSFLHNLHTPVILYVTSAGSLYAMVRNVLL